MSTQIPKLYTVQKLKPLLARFQKRKKKVVFTNGCFDILHAGHARYLNQAKKCGDILVVALNSDISVRKIKGSLRPIVPLKERAEIMGSLKTVDFVTFFHEDTPYKTIAALKPDILVKGGDWSKDKIVGADLVLKNGGEVKTIRYVPGKSTTNIIDAILKKYEGKQ